MPKAIAIGAAPTPRRAAAAVRARRADLRGAGARLHHAPSRRPGSDARHDRGARRIPPSSSISKRLGVSAVELMPITAWIDERHLPPLGLTNAWGYNPVTFMALDPRLAPGGVAELRATVAALRERGHRRHPRSRLQPHRRKRRARPDAVAARPRQPAYYRHAPTATALWSTTPAAATRSPATSPSCAQLVLDTLRHFVRHAGVDGFRFDLGADPRPHRRTASTATRRCFETIAADPVLARPHADRRALGHRPRRLPARQFPARFLEWNDRYRDDVRRFWRGDDGMLGALATRLAGSSDIFDRDGRTHAQRQLHRRP